jgi:hypothetical protein
VLRGFDYVQDRGLVVGFRERPLQLLIGPATACDHKSNRQRPGTAATYPHSGATLTPAAIAGGRSRRVLEGSVIFAARVGLSDGSLAARSAVPRSDGCKSCPVTPTPRTTGSRTVIVWRFTWEKCLDTPRGTRTRAPNGGGRRLGLTPRCRAPAALLASPLAGACRCRVGPRLGTGEKAWPASAKPP